MGSGKGQNKRLRSREESDDKIRWAAGTDALKELAQSAADGDETGFDAAWSQFQQFAKNFDAEKFLNTEHVPDDAGEQEEALRKILARIPDGWGRWIGCAQGWYPLIITLDEQLSKVAPDYTIHQVKEKYGQLSYYAHSGLSVVDENNPSPPRPVSTGDEAADDITWEAWGREQDSWRKRLEVYKQTKEGKQRVAEVELRTKLFENLVSTAEEESKNICDRCGTAGELCCTLAHSPWYKALCPEHRREEQYIKAKDYKKAWKLVHPYYLQQARNRWAQENQDKRIVVVSSDESQELVVDATYVRDPEVVPDLTKQEWDVVFIGDDGVGRAYMTALQEQYAEHIAGRAKLRESGGYSGIPPEGCPNMYHFHQNLESPRYLFQDLGASMRLRQPEFFKPGSDEDQAGSEEDLEEILRKFYD